MEKKYSDWTDQDVEAYIEKHGPSCEICLNDEEPLVVDVEEDGHAVGALCRECLHGVDHFMRDVQLLLWAASYLNLNRVYEKKNREPEVLEEVNPATAN